MYPTHEATTDDAVDASPPVGFADLGLGDELVATLDALGYTEPTPIQATAIPPLLDGVDLIGRAATGTGKTAAFALPLLDRLHHTTDRDVRSPGPTALVLVPTRELAVQVHAAVERYGARLGTTATAVYGGTSIRPQFDALRARPDVVVGTPGRVLDHVTRGSLDLGAIRTVVLDEADEMLDMGFADELGAILDAAPVDRQTVLLSATMPERLGSIAERHLSEPARIDLDEPGERTLPLVTQVAHLTKRTDRDRALARVLDAEQPGAAIVFCRTRDDVDRVAEHLNACGHRAEPLHGGMGQEQRDRAMGRLKQGVASLLVATDVAARGIDVDHLTHVINHDVPQSGEAYVHRIGRVGRAGRSGVAITFAGPGDRRRLHRLGESAGAGIEIRPVPTADEVAERRRQMTRDEVAALLAGTDGDEVADGPDYRELVLSLLAEGHDPLAVAAAALRRAHEAAGRTGGDDEVIEHVEVRSERPRDRRDSTRSGREPRRDSTRSGRDSYGRDGDGRGHTVEPGYTSLQFSLGRHGGMRPADLVGAIANEAGIRGNEIGAIRIMDKSSFVQVPDRHAHRVVERLDGATIRSKPVRVRRSK